MPEQTKVMGKDWAEARREGSVDRLRLTLQTALANQTALTFELGCGHGHWLAAYGAAHPAEFCVGIDLVTHRVERSQRKQALGKLANVVFLKAEATEFLDALLPTQQLAKVFILYPDPWPRRVSIKSFPSFFLKWEICTSTRLESVSSCSSKIWFDRIGTESTTNCWVRPGFWKAR